MIGPEGGWIDAERRQFRDAGWTAASLGPSILRAETAVCAALGVVSQMWLVEVLEDAATLSKGSPVQSNEPGMSVYTIGISDILITVVTVITQILIARWFFSERKNMSPALARALTGILYFLWATFLFAIPFRFPSLEGMLIVDSANCSERARSNGKPLGHDGCSIGGYLLSIPFRRLSRRAAAFAGTPQVDPGGGNPGGSGAFRGGGLWRDRREERFSD